MSYLIMPLEVLARANNSNHVRPDCISRLPDLSSPVKIPRRREHPAQHGKPMQRLPSLKYSWCDLGTGAEHDCGSWELQSL